MPVEGKCEQCGAAFVAPPSDEQRFCGLKCYHKTLVKPPKRCAQCGVSMKKPNASTKFCGHQCFADSKKTRVARPGKASLGYSISACRACGNSFIGSHPDQKYCNAECRWKFARTNAKTCETPGCNAPVVAAHGKRCRACSQKDHVSRAHKRAVQNLGDWYVRQVCRKKGDERDADLQSAVKTLLMAKRAFKSKGFSLSNCQEAEA